MIYPTRSMSDILDPMSKTNWAAEYDKITSDVIAARPCLSPQAADRITRGVKEEMQDLIQGFRTPEGKRIRHRPLLTYGQARILFSKLNNGTR